MKIIFLLLLCLVLTSCATKPWYYTKPYYCLNFVNQQMVNEDGSRAPDQRQFCIKTKPEEIGSITGLGKIGYDYSMGMEMYGYWEIEGPYPPLETPEFIAYQKWLRGK